MTALLALLLAAAPIDAVVSRSIDTTPERADDLLRRVVAAIGARSVEETHQHLPAGTVTAACAARRACLKDLGTALGARAVVGVDVGHVTGQMAVSLEAVLVADGKRLAQRSFTVDSAGYPAGVEGELKVFAAALKSALPPEDAPVAAKLEPVPAPAKPVVIAAAAPSRPVMPIVLGAAAVVAAGLALGLGVMGGSTAAQLDRAKTTWQGQPASSLSRPQAQEIAARANGQYLGAGLAGSTAGALGLGAALSWLLAD